MAAKPLGLLAGSGQQASRRVNSLFTSCPRREKLGTAKKARFRQKANLHMATSFGKLTAEKFQVDEENLGKIVTIATAE